MDDDRIVIGADYSSGPDACVAVIRKGAKIVTCVRLYPHSYDEFKQYIEELAKRWGAADAFISAPPVKL